VFLVRSLPFMVAPKRRHSTLLVDAPITMGI
jgi:hypothetical protein